MKQEGSAVEFLMEQERETYRRNVARDLQWIKDVHARDALMLSPGSEAKNAHEFFASVMKMLAANGQESSSGGDHFSWEPVSAQVTDSEEMGWVYGTTKLARADGTEILGKYMSVWIKEDGEWRVAAEMRNDNA